MPTIEEIVANGVEAQALIDKYLSKAYAQAERLSTTTEQGVAEGLVRGIAAKKIIGDARAAQGKIAEVAALFAVLHRDQTDACVAAGADLGDVSTAGGIIIGGFGTLGGGR